MSKHLSTSRHARGLVASFAAVALGVTGLVALATSASAASAGNPNGTAYWLAQYPNAIACYKYEGTRTDNAHGKVTDNKTAVTLKPYQASWPGDHWEVLVVKGGTEGRVVYESPSAGVAYFAPTFTNPAGKVIQQEVSHFIVCKGTTPAVQVTPVAPVFTPPTCEAPGTFLGTDTNQYTWNRSGPDTAPVLTAVAVGNVQLIGQTVFDGGDLTQLTGEICLGELPRQVTPEVQVTPPTCEAAGTALGADSPDYIWASETVEGELWLFANPVGNVTLSKTEFGPYKLAKLTGEICLSDTPVIPVTPVVPTAPTVVKAATLAETGFPLLGVLGLAGSFSLIGGGLVNARRLLRKSA